MASAESIRADGKQSVLTLTVLPVLRHISDTPPFALPSGGMNNDGYMPCGFVTCRLKLSTLVDTQTLTASIVCALSPWHAETRSLPNRP
jgi:hypothetical protein